MSSRRYLGASYRFSDSFRLRPVIGPNQTNCRGPLLTQNGQVPMSRLILQEEKG
jgi:hypothetical protein